VQSVTSTTTATTTTTTITTAWTLKLETETLASPAETRRWPRELRLDRDVKAGLNLVVIAVVKLFFTFIGC